MPFFESSNACVRRVARKPHALLWCALLAATAVLAACGDAGTNSTAIQGPQPEISSPTIAPSPTSTATPLAHGGISAAAGLPAPVTVAPAPNQMEAFVPLGATPGWVARAGGPVPPYGPRTFAAQEVLASTSNSLLAHYASSTTQQPLFKGPFYATGDSPPPAMISSMPSVLAEGWDETENFLVMGTDRKNGTGDWRTDSLMVVGLDRANNSAAIFSIPRDLYVQIPGYGWGRINQADYLGELREPNGGPKLLGGIVENVLGIPTDHWVRVHMDGFIPMIDALGGITVTLETPFYDMWQSATTTSTVEMYLPAGTHHLNGRQTYLFSRLRYVGSDIGRASRQRTVLWALKDRLLSGNFLTQLPQLLETFRQTVSTDLGIFDLASLATVAFSMNEDDVRSGGLKIEDLRSYSTNAGAAVLTLEDPAHVREVVESVWSADATPLAESFVGNGDIATYVTTSAPTEALTTTIEITVTPSLTGTEIVSTTVPMTDSAPLTENLPGSVSAP